MSSGKTPFVERGPSGASACGQGTAEEMLGRLASLPVQSPARQALRRSLVEMHWPQVRQVALQYARRGEPVEDLMQLACVGLVKAINNYQPSYGSKFLSYAMPLMRGEIRQYFRDVAWMVQVPRRLQQNRATIKSTVAELTDRLGRAPTVAELAQHTELSVEEVNETSKASAAYAAVSLDMSVGVEGDAVSTLADTFGAEDSRLDSAVNVLALKPLIAALPERERAILALRFYGECNQADIAERIGISQMHVSRLLTRTLAWMRTGLLAENGQQPTQVPVQRRRRHTCGVARGKRVSQ